MIIFGSYYTRFKKHAVVGVCPNCGGENTMNLTAGCRTYHVMFVPVFPGSKRITQRCGHCRAEYVPLADKRQAAARMQAETRRPWYLYFGLWLLAALAVAIVVAVVTGGSQEA